MEEENISPNGSTNYVEPQTIATTTTAIADAEPTDKVEVKEKSKKSQFGILKLAVGRFQPRSPKTDQKKKKEKNKPVKSEKNVGSKSPLNQEEDIQSPTAPVSGHASPAKEDGNLSEDNFICISEASSPSPSTSLSSKRSGIITPRSSVVNLQELDNQVSQYNSTVNLQELDATQSRYASAVDLQDLDAPMSQYRSTNNLQTLTEHEETFKDPDEVHGRISGDAMIDTKAEEFIAQFHKVLKHEQMNRRHSPRIRMG